MSSLFSKLKALVNARVRGPRRYKKEPQPQAETAPATRPVPEVTEAPARRVKLPEVSVETSTRPAATVTRQPAARAEEPEADGSQFEGLEEERVVDLLKGKQKE
jgi:hypothetical protein